uniref:Putative glycosyltransferase n=1 Tax=viral metagenome TaxID=1070528 RepID=A0A6M3LET6_9ZZZZ
MKVLWIGDAVINSGFAVVTHNICNRLVSKCDLEVFGIGYNTSSPNRYNYNIYPAHTENDIYGFVYANAVIQKTDPDVIVIFNDDHIIERYMAKLLGTNSRIVPLFPINMLPLDKERMLGLSVAGYNVPKVMTYTEFSKKEILKINPNLDVTAIYHGVDHSTFSPLPEKPLGLKNCFVVGTVGTNTYRKRIDLFLRGFARFANDKSDVKCLVHATSKDIAYDLPTIIRDLGIEEKTILSITSKDFNDLNTLYNMMDVNVNTSLGEGFGLPLIEGAACGVPVLCPEHGNLVDIWGDNATYIKLRDTEYVAGTKFLGGVIDLDDMVVKLNTLYEDRELLSEMRTKALGYAKKDQFNWDKISEKVYKTIISANNGRISYIR